jgi:hypothetical protein
VQRVSKTIFKTYRPHSHWPLLAAETGGLETTNDAVKQALEN